MFNKITIQINNKIGFKKKENLKKEQYKNVLSSNKERHSSINIIKYTKTSRNLSKTNNNFKSSMTLGPLNEELSNKLTFYNNNKKRNLANFNFIKAPSMLDNHYQINKLIRLSKRKKIEELKNVHNKILISESQSYRNNLYITSSDFVHNFKNNLTKNFSCQELQLKKKKRHKFNNSMKIHEKQKTFYKTASKINSIDSKLIKKNFVFRNEKILSALKKNNSEKETKNTLDSVSKMRIQLMDSLYNEFNPIKLSNVSKRLVKFHYFQNIQNKKVENISIINQFIKEGYIKRLLCMKQLFKRIYDKYIYDMNLYLEFLKNKLIELKEKSYSYNARVFNLANHIENKVLRILYKQSDLEYLVKIRNFLLKIKEQFHKKEKPSIYYDLLLMRDSKILLIGNFIESVDFIKQTSNKYVIKFMKHLNDRKQEIFDNDDYYNLTEELLDSINSGNNELKIIFSSEQEFFKIYDILTDKNLSLIYSLQDSERSKFNIQQNLNKQLPLYNHQKKNDTLINEIKEKQKLKESLIKKNELLKQKYLYYNESLNNKIYQKKMISSEHKKNHPLYLDTNSSIYMINREKYNKLLKKFKYRGMLLLQKIIKFIKKFLKLKYANDGFFNYFHNINRLYVLDLDVNSFNKDNIENINIYILKAFSIYEEICKYVMFTHEQLKSDEKNITIIQKQQNIIDHDNKVQNALYARKEQFLKDLEDKQKIYEKAINPILYIKSRSDVENKVKRKKIKDDRNNKLKEELEENEFNNLIEYEDNAL